jgi:hypothetical protein
VAESSYYDFEETTRGIPESAPQRWHQEYEKNRNYGESWFFLVDTKQGGILFVTISITNLGLRTFDTALDLRFYTPEGEVFKFLNEYQREDITTTGNGLDLTVGGNRLKGTENTYHLSINEAQLQMDMTLERILPAFQFGNGRVTFYKDRSAEWSIGFDLPRANASGILTANGKMFNLAGNGYHDHTWSTIKLPTFMEKWHNLRLYGKRFSLILHQIHLTQKFGGGLLCIGLIGDGDKLIPTRSFLYEPLKWRKEMSSQLPIPTELQLSVKTEEYFIAGTIKEAQFLESIDVLSQLAWPIQLLIKSFYAKPYLIRYRAKYDVEVTTKDGLRHQLSGFCLVGINSY